MRWRDTDLDGTVDETLYYTYDGNQNVTGAFNASTEAVERYDYDPYGNRTVLNGENDADGAVSDWGMDADGVSDVDNRIAFAGYRLDVESGLYHVRYRMYHPTLGRWTQRDPLGYVDGMNLYEYVAGGPGKWIDPLGLLIDWRGDDCDVEEAVKMLDDLIEALPDGMPLKDLLKDARDSDDYRVKITLDSHGRTYVGDYKKGKIDMRDMEIITSTIDGDDPLLTKQSMFGHEVAEQIFIQHYKYGKHPAHAEGKKAEEAITGWKRVDEYKRETENHNWNHYNILEKGNKRATIKYTRFPKGRVSKAEVTIETKPAPEED